MTRHVDLTGRVFGKLTATSYTKGPTGKGAWVCICECGETRVVNVSYLNTGKVLHCGKCTIPHLYCPSDCLVGKVFGSLTVVRRVQPMWECICDCGKTCLVKHADLLNGTRLSCGHMRWKHMQSTTPEYKTWIRMKNRCYDPNATAFERWGGRGIRVCDRWLNDFNAFLQDMGPRPSKDHSLDRIDNDGQYEPSNCRWATRSEQCNNRTQPKRRRDHPQQLLLDIHAARSDGQTLIRISSQFGVPVSTVAKILRTKRGLSC